MTAGAPGDRPGLAAERTVLAWDRTALAMLANGALLLLRDVRSGSGLAYVPATVALVAAVTVAALGRRRARRVVTGPLAGAGRVVAAAGLCTVGIGVLAVVALAVDLR